MTDIKQVKKELLDAINSRGAALENVAREDALDSVLSLYFAAASHMPRQLTFEAVMNSLVIADHDRKPSRSRAQEILRRHLR